MDKSDRKNKVLAPAIQLRHPPTETGLQRRRMEAACVKQREAQAAANTAGEQAIVLVRIENNIMTSLRIAMNSLEKKPG